MPVAKFHFSFETASRIPRSCYWSASSFALPMSKSLHKLAQMARQCQNPSHLHKLAYGPHLNCETHMDGI
jgi:hypothetical protein